MALTPPLAGEADEPLSEVDLRHLTEAERGALSGLLAEYGVQHEWVGGDLLAPAAEEELVEDLIEAVAAPDPSIPLPPPHGRAAVLPPLPMEAAVARPWKRFVGWLIESYALMALVWVAETATAGAGPVVGALLVVLNDVVLVGWRGQTVGMTLMRIRVCEPPGSRRPGWPAVVVRWLVATWPSLVLAAASGVASRSIEGALATIQLIWFAVCFAPILWDRFARGLHDRAAGTVVLVADYTGPLVDPRTA